MAALVASSLPSSVVFITERYRYAFSPSQWLRATSRRTDTADRRNTGGARTVVCVLCRVVELYRIASVERKEDRKNKQWWINIIGYQGARHLRTKRTVHFRTCAVAVVQRL